MSTSKPKCGVDFDLLTDEPVEGYLDLTILLDVASDGETHGSRCGWVDHRPHEGVGDPE